MKFTIHLTIWKLLLLNSKLTILASLSLLIHVIGHLKDSAMTGRSLIRMDVKYPPVPGKKNTLCVSTSTS